jgi:hypothetical protein
MPEHNEAVLLDTNCSRCGTPLKVRIADLGAARFVECESCAAKPPFNTRFVAANERVADPAYEIPPTVAGLCGRGCRGAGRGGMLVE